MKQLFFVLFLATAITACNNGDDKKSAEEIKPGDTKVASATTTENLAYPVKDWGDWQPGNMDNLKTALQSLKDFASGNIDACVGTFADSVELRFDNYNRKVSKDTLVNVFKQWRAQSKTIDIRMDDYETVKSKDGKQEYVSIWYTQKNEDQKGKWDSVVVMDDLKFEKGKISVLDEKVRHFQGKKM